MKKGFTLIEVLLSVSIIALISGMMAPIGYSLYLRAELDRAAYLIAATGRRANLLARSGYHDAAWGVARSGTTLTLFKGATFATRNQSYDEIIDLPPALSYSGGSEFVFQKFLGTTASSSLTITSFADESRTLTINAHGTITY